MSDGFYGVGGNKPPSRFPGRAVPVRASTQTAGEATAPNDPTADSGLHATRAPLTTDWQRPSSVSARPTSGDYRDHIPQLIPSLADQYNPVVYKGQWTSGLCECWSDKHTLMLQSIHISCFHSVVHTITNPLAWRGIFCGRTLSELFYYSPCGRAARTGVAAGKLSGQSANLGAFRKTINMQTVVHCLGGLLCVPTCGGTCLCNACAPCTSRSRTTLRQQYDLPPTCCCKGRADDIMVHCCCNYCATHQDAMELGYRGIDTPGMWPLDLTASSYISAPGFKHGIDQRQTALEAKYGVEASLYTQQRGLPPGLPVAPPKATDMQR